MTKHFKTLSDHGNILFYVWNRVGDPETAMDLRRYGRHISTFFPEQNEWYKTKITNPEKYQKI